MSLCFDDKGREHVMAFAYPPGLSGIPESFLQQAPSAYELRTLEAGAFFALHVQDYHRLLQTHAGFESMMRKMIEQMFIGMLQRHRAWQTLSMEARFQAFMQRSGWLLHRAPQKYLASYLNIDPTNFSKLLRRTSW